MKRFGNVREMIEYPKGGILSKVIFKSTVSDVTLFCMAAGTSIGEHTARRDAVIYVVEGKGEFILGKERIPMKEGTMIFMGRDAVHSLDAEENTSFLLSLHA